MLIPEAPVGLPIYPKIMEDQIHRKKLFDVVLLEGVPTRVTRVSNQRTYTCISCGYVSPKRLPTK
jgi:hypothetical protein